MAVEGFLQAPVTDTDSQAVVSDKGYNVEEQLAGFDKIHKLSKAKDIRVTNRTKGDELTAAVLAAGSYEFGTK